MHSTVIFPLILEEGVVVASEQNLILGRVVVVSKQNLILGGLGVVVVSEQNLISAE